jgi:hypothetical protein
MKAPAVENMAAAKTAAMEAAASESPAVKGATMEAAAVKAATVETTTMAATAMPAANFGGQIVGGNPGCRRRTRIDQRKRLGALIRYSRQHQYRSCRKAPATNEAALGN